MAKIQGRFIADDAVDASKVKLGNNQALRARNAADSADVDLIKLNGSDVPEFPSTPQVGGTDVALITDIPTIPSVFEIQGNYNASTNTPALANTDTGVDNFLYIVNVAGSQDFGAGSITFAAGDWVYFANGVWNKADNIDDVVSVNGQIGTVVLDSDDISEGVSNVYFTEPRVLATDLTGFVAGANAAIADTDTVLQGLEKAQGQINALSSATQSFNKETFVLDGTDISNQFVTLANSPVANSASVLIGGIEQEEGVDYSFTGTQLNFAGDIAADAIVGDRLVVKYAF